MKNIRIAYTLFILLSVLFACNNTGESGSSTKRNKAVEIDSSVTRANAFNNLFLDSAKLEGFLGKHTDYAPYRQQYFAFYRQRNYEYAWFDTDGINEQAKDFMNLLNTTIIDSRDSSLYNKKLTTLYTGFVKDSTKHEEVSPLQTELYLTGQFFAYIAKAYNNEDIDATELGWFIPKKKFDFTKMVDSVIVSKGKGQDRYLPLNHQYKNLQDALTKYYNIQKNNRWDSIPGRKKPYKQGDTATAIAQVKERLYVLGDMPEKDTSTLFDTALATGLRNFQQRMGLEETGKLDTATLNELNYPLRERIKQLLVNLERMRWLPDESDSSYIIVNIPEYRLYVYDDGHVVFPMNVVVGEEGTNTVIFTDKLKYIVFSPYWNVPTSIVKKEILPEMDKDPNYLEEQNMEVTGNEDGIPVIRQKPGEKNSLGLVKFLFPNNYNIYLHDTPFKSLFSKANRNFSHGCIRLEDAKKMAMYLLQDQPSYTEETIDSLMHLDHEKWVTLKQPVRVSITYFTAWVDSAGRVNFRKDIYGHDTDMARKLFVAG